MLCLYRVCPGTGHRIRKRRGINIKMEVKDYVFYSCAAPDHSIRMGISQEKETGTRTGLEGKEAGGIRQGTAGQADKAPEPGEAVFLYDIRGRDIKISKGLPDSLPGRGKVHSGGCVESSWMVKGRSGSVKIPSWDKQIQK